MTLPPKLKTKYLTRLDELIKEGKRLLSTVRVEKKQVGEDWDTREPEYQEEEIFCEHQQLTRWKRNCITLLEIIVPQNSKNREIINEFSQDFVAFRTGITWTIGALQAVFDDFKSDFMEGVASQVEAEIVSGLMEQSEGLLDEGQPQKYDYVPAAVLAGAVLEKSLRTLCGRQNPPVDIMDSKGEHKKMNVIIDDLKKSGLYIETKAKQLRAWAGIRNDAAHGAFDKFKRTDVEAMIKGINQFLADHM